MKQYRQGVRVYNNFTPMMPRYKLFGTRGAIETKNREDERDGEERNDTIHDSGSWKIRVGKIENRRSIGDARVCGKCKPQANPFRNIYAARLSPESDRGVPTESALDAAWDAQAGQASLIYLGVGCKGCRLCNLSNVSTRMLTQLG